MTIEPLASLGQLTSQSNTANNDDKKLKEACRDFEGILINMMLKSMRKTLTGDDIFGNSMGKDIYKSMYDQEIAEKIARGENNLGVGDALYRQLTKYQKPSAENETMTRSPAKLIND
ncbi:MAG: rod-binding protein [Proteobacteria bacterium]|nr:rod-binding protein [Pseudomonadota bacterium]